MIVYTFGRALGAADLSPFCVKLETWLRMAGLPYEQRVGNVTKTPKGKLPTAKIDGRIMSDSGLIIEHLRKQHGDPLGEDAMPGTERATARALQALLESELYFSAVYFRWIADAGWQHMGPALIGYMRKMGAPGLIAPMLARSARRSVMKQLQAQGTGRHDPQEIAAMAAAGWSAIGDYLGDKPFMLGAAPHTIDASVFGMLHAVLAPPIDSPIKDAIRAHPNLLAYHDRVLERWWPEMAAPQAQRAAA